MAEIVEGDLATKQDIKELKDEMQKLEYRLVIKLTSIMAAMFTLATGIAVALLRYQIE